MTTAISNATAGAVQALELPAAAGRGAEFLSILDESTPQEPTPAPNVVNLGAHASIARVRTAVPAAAVEEPPSAPVDDPEYVIDAPEDPVEEPPPAPASNSFVRTSDSRLPHLPRFTEVPDGVKHPLGPYRQAPEEFGGDWWYVNPFTGTEPWTRLNGSSAALLEERPIAPAEFVAVFGDRPTSATSNNPKIAAIEWEQNLEHFKGAGVPEGFTQEQVDAANQLYEAWGLGPATFYEGRYGWRAHFANGFEAAPYTAIEAPHLVVAQYQMQMALLEGAEPATRHPFVPPGVWPDGRGSSDA